MTADLQKSTVITNISELHTQNADRDVLKNAAVVIENDRIAWVGSATDAPSADQRYDAEERAMLPGWVDSHSHMIFDGDRSAEFEARMAGDSYSAGGINLTTSATRSASDQRLLNLLSGRVDEALAGGTTYMETKTGYGLNIEEEIRHARLAYDAKNDGIIDAVTFLGAHLVPTEADSDAYVDDVVGPMLDGVLPYVEWADVFCERGAFNTTQSRRVLEAAQAEGLGLRVHGNQLGHGDGIQLATEFDAASVDHVNYVNDADVEALAATWTNWDSNAVTGDMGTVAGCLPACDLSTRQPLAPGRRLLDAGIEIAIASNCNPGTSYTTSMNFCVSTAVLQMHLSLEEAIRAATMGGALALRAHEEVGSIEVGKRADLHLLNAPAAIHLAYRPGMNHTHSVWRAGQQRV